MPLFSRLKDTGLAREACYINGQWTGAADDGRIAVHNPATEEILGEVPNCGAFEAERAVHAAAAAWQNWKQTAPERRGALLCALAEAILARTDDLALLLTLEQGKPLAEARAEIAQAAAYFQWFAEEARRTYGRVIPSPVPGRQPLTLRQSVGVAAAITPWNFPCSMIARKAAPALAAGCPVVVKPASRTPYSALALAELAHQSGFPPGVFNVVTGSSAAIGGVLTGSEAVRVLSFTGSTAVGKQLMEQSAPTLKKLGFELGGNAPFLVFKDASPERTTAAAVACKFRNSGQTCVCANRFLVERSAHDAFVETLVREARALRMGPGNEPETTQGPLITRQAVERMQDLVADARLKGATVLCGGQAVAGRGHFFPPTVLGNVTPEMRVFREEIFGPIAPVLAFEDEQEAVRLANDTEYGLAAYLFTTDAGRAWRMGAALDYGMVGINDVALAMPEAPFGGMKSSGLGREGGAEGIEEYLETKYLLWGGLED